MIIFKNFFSFALTFYAYDWIIEGGVRPTLLAISSIQVVVCLSSIPMCKQSDSTTLLRKYKTDSASDIFGKRCRAFYHRHDLLEMTKLR
jgi:hypothetical protein